ncbi:MAG: phosphoribosylformylglycinamidine cyclo-ligase [Geminicoccaceae bacterium]
MTQGTAGGRYAESGVDIDAGHDLVNRIAPMARATRRTGVMTGLGGFGALFDLAACGFKDPILVATTDGVGTKVLLATEANATRNVGIDLVAMCVNDLVVQGAQPLFFLDYFATGRLDNAIAADVIAGVSEGCRQAGCALIGGETAEMPGLYGRGEFDLAGFAVGAVERDAVLPRVQAIREGDVVLGLASSGIHANGYSLVRLILREQRLALSDTAPFGDGTLAARLLEPTRIYVASCLAAIAAGGVKAMAHITGGGLVENPPRVLREGLVARIDARSWPLPPLFAWLAQAGRLSALELARTFNCGIGMVLLVAPESVDAVTSALVGAGETAYRIGTIVEAGGQARVDLLHLDEAWPAAAPPS